MKAGDKMICIEDHIFKSFPHDNHVAKGELLTVKGFLAGCDLVLTLDPEKHKPDYDHLTEVNCVVWPENLCHFKEVE